MYRQMTGAMILSCACAAAMADHGFDPVAALAPEAAGAVAIAVGDVTGDDRDDVVVLASGAKSIYRNRVLLYAQAEGGFARPVSIEYHPEPTGYEAQGADIALSDLDADGDLDIVVSHGGYPTAGLVALRNDASGFAAFATPVEDALRQMQFMDVDGDGHMDLVGQGTHNGVVIHHGDGAAGFGGATGLSYGSSPVSFHLVDMDGDGRQDFLHHDWSAIHLLRHEGSGFSSVPRVLLNTNYSRGLAVADFDGDGRADLLGSAGFSQPSLVLHPQGTDGRFRRKVYLGRAPGYVDSLGTADLDANGLPDLLVLDQNQGRLGIRLARPGGGFQPPAAHETGDVVRLVAGDVNNDGMMDVVMLGNWGGVSYLASRGSSTGADLAVSVGLDPDAVAVRVENRGDAASSSFQIRLSLQARLGWIDADDLPDGCDAFTTWDDVLEVTCQMPALAAGAHHQRAFTFGLAGPAQGTRITARARVTNAWFDLRPNNDVAMKSVFATSNGEQ